MDERIKTLLSTTLLGASLLTLLLFQIKLTGPAGAHFIFLAFGTLLYALIIFGLWIDEPWAMQLATVFFALALADVVWMYLRSHDTLFALVALFINAGGLFLTATGGAVLGGYQSLETYDIDEDIRDLKQELESMKRARRKKR